MITDLQVMEDGMYKIEIITTGFVYNLKILIST